MAAMSSAGVLDDLFLWGMTDPTPPLQELGMPSASELDRMFQESLRYDNVARQTPPSSAADKVRLATGCRRATLRHVDVESPQLQQARQSLARTRFFIPAHCSDGKDYHARLDGDMLLEPCNYVKSGAPSRGVSVFADIAAARRVRGRSAQSRAALADTVLEAYGTGDGQIMNSAETKLRFARVFVGEEVPRGMGRKPWCSPEGARAWTSGDEARQRDRSQRQRLLHERFGA
ncbi:unnamed protein product [Symbiodinium natans]|uniref:Uncharacterized protein n=1 Tax=Symbiodinium natans TaxID=878477 RepID=A0A812QQZ3_9DINO|nr:unnamed protein product [Symbiodinium natans]